MLADSIPPSTDPKMHKYYNQVVSKWPDYTRARYRLGEIMIQRGDIQGATAQVDEVLGRNPRDTQALLLRARLLLQKDHANDAIKDLDEVLKQEPNSRAGLYFMAEANLRAGQVERARAFAGDLERFYPNNLPGRLMQVLSTWRRCAKSPSSLKRADGSLASGHTTRDIAAASAEYVSRNRRARHGYGQG